MRVLTFATLLTFCAPLPSYAQQAGGPVVSAAAAAPDSVTVAKIFRTVPYDAAERGPLLLIPTRSEQLREFPAAPQNDPAWSLASLGATLGRRVISAGTVGVLAPRQMTDIVAHPGKANPYLGLRSSDLIKVLLSSLDPSQWQSLESADGIGYADLTDSQRQMYDQLIPDGVTFSQQTVTFAPGNPNPEIQSQDRNDIDRTSVRLRLNRTVDLQLVYKASPAALGTEFIVDSTNPVSSQPHVAMNEPKSPAQPREDVHKSAYGQMLVREMPNQLKPSQLDYEAATLNPRVDLEGLNEQSTLGDLVQHVSAATHLDIVVDRRARTLPVLLRGSTGVRAGDLLKAIALAVTGTYRKVGRTSTFVLTSDIEGTGARVTDIELWAEKAETERQKLLSASADAIKKADPLAHTTFAEGDPVAPSPEIINSIEDDYRHTQNGHGPTQSVSALPPALQDKVRLYLDELKNSSLAYETDRVRLELRLDLALLIPGIGPIEHDNTLTFGLDPRTVRQAAFTEPEIQILRLGTPRRHPCQIGPG